jgi:hypothetical protein
MTKAKTTQSTPPAIPAKEPRAFALAESATPDERTLAARVLDAMHKGVRSPAVNVSRPAGADKLESEMKDGVLGSLRLCQALGTENFDFADWALGELTDGVLSQRDDADTAKRELNGALALLHDMKPADPLEAMLVSQMAACHHQAMRGLGRMRGVQSIDQLRANERAANAFMRTFTAQLEALKRYRSKGEQTVRVERVYVAEGGQAIVGAVQTGGGPGGSPKISDQSHAKEAKG